MNRVIIIFSLLTIVLVLSTGCDDKSVEYQPDLRPIYLISIPTLEGASGEVLPGENVTIPVTVVTDSIIGSFQFLIGYDADAFTLITSTQGSDLSLNNWEYFNYSSLIDSITCSGCPSGFVLISAIAELDNVQPYATEAKVNSLFNLTFRATTDTTYQCTTTDFRFFWRDCSDNQFINWNHTKLFVSETIYQGNTDTSLAVQVEDFDAGYPTFFGAQNSDCDPASQSQVYREVIFVNGSIFIKCAK